MTSFIMFSNLIAETYSPNILFDTEKILYQFKYHLPGLFLQEYCKNLMNLLNSNLSYRAVHKHDW